MARPKTKPGRDTRGKSGGAAADYASPIRPTSSPGDEPADSQRRKSESGGPQVAAPVEEPRTGQGHRRGIVMRDDLAAGGPPPETTQVADGLPRRAFTVDEVERMIQHGVLREPEPFELIGGELVAMAPKDRRHEVIRSELLLYWARRMGGDLKVASEIPLKLSKHDAPEPDLIVFPANLLAPDVHADTVLLVVEVANSSLPKDLTTKAPRYAAAGVREYWVIDARSHLTVVFREPRPTGEYGYRQEIPATETLVPTLVPSLAVRLADLDLA